MYCNNDIFLKKNYTREIRFCWIIDFYTFFFRRAVPFPPMRTCAWSCLSFSWFILEEEEVVG